jgi:uncharacterized membrane-anchored protein
MKTKVIILALALALWLVTSPAFGQQDKESVLSKVKWQRGPCIGALGDIASIKVPEGYLFADGDDTRLLMELMHNPTSGTELGFLAAADSNWFVVFEFDESGYIKDDEKDSLDADAILKSIQKGTEVANKERAKHGWAPLNVLGWQKAPSYNPVTNNLEWAIRAESENHPILNWNTRLLGRKGVMRVTLVVDPEQYKETLPHFQSLLAGFGYNTGERYAEYRQGDKIAKYGLSALVVGGATAVAAKSGILKYLWKGLIFVGIAALAFVKKLFGRKPE